MGPAVALPPGADTPAERHGGGRRLSTARRTLACLLLLASLPGCLGRDGAVASPPPTPSAAQLAAEFDAPSASAVPRSPALGAPPSGGAAWDEETGLTPLFGPSQSVAADETGDYPNYEFIMVLRPNVTFGDLVPVCAILEGQDLAQFNGSCFVSLAEQVARAQLAEARREAQKDLEEAEEAALRAAPPGAELGSPTIVSSSGTSISESPGAVAGVGGSPGGVAGAGESPGALAGIGESSEAGDGLVGGASSENTVPAPWPADPPPPPRTGVAVSPAPEAATIASVPSSVAAEALAWPFATIVPKSEEDMVTIRRELTAYVRFFERDRAISLDARAIPEVAHGPAPFEPEAQAPVPSGPAPRVADAVVPDEDAVDTAVEALWLDDASAGTSAQAPAPAAAAGSLATPVQPDSVEISDPYTDVIPWGIDRIDQPSLPLNGEFLPAGTGAGVDVYILDTGLYADGLDFVGRVGEGYSAIGSSDTADGQGHGTHVAGTAVGAVHGVAREATVYPVQVLNSYGEGSSSQTIDGLGWVQAQAAASGRPSVASLSLGTTASPALDAAVEQLVAAGTSLVTSAGNSYGGDACQQSPARVGVAITVAASGPDDVLADYSNVGSCVDIVAPGTKILSAGVGSPNATRVLSGTSQACPHVTGAVAILLGHEPGLTPAEVAERIVDSAVNIDFGTSVPDLLVQVENGTLF